MHPFRLLTALLISVCAGSAAVGASSDGIPQRQTPLSFVENGQQLDALTGGGIAVADLNDDGNLDLFIGNGDDRGSRVYWGDGLGQFADSGQSLVSSSGNHPVLGDINEDGRLDVITGRTVWLNDGQGHFEARPESIGDGDNNEYVTVALADFNGDDHLDVFASIWHFSPPNGESRVYLNDGQGLFQDTGQQLGDEIMAATALGDVNNDGFIDAITTGWKETSNYSPNRVWLNDGSGNFHDEQILYQGTEHVHGAALGDLNGDGHLDLVLGMNSASRAGQIYLNDGQGSFIAGQDLGGTWAQDVALADFDGDGSLDIFLLCGMTPQKPANEIWLNDTQGNFRDSGVRLENEAVGQGVGIGDFNHDGKPDVFVTNADYVADGTGNYVAQAFPPRVWLNTTGAKEQTSDYLGQTPPGSTPEIFAPDVVSVDGRYEYGVAISPDGDELFFTADDPGAGLMVMRRVNGEWTQPEAANLRGNHSWEFEAFYTQDGQKLFFASMNGMTSKLWYVEKGADGWGEAQYLDSPANEASAFWATFTTDGTMYYTNVSKIRIFRAAQVDGAYPEVEDIGLPMGGHPSIAPDESYLLFNSTGLGGFGEDDIFVTFRQNDGTWSEPLNLGEEINTGYAETCASLSPDGKYIFFSRYNESGGKSNIYWVSSEIIERLHEAGGNVTQVDENPTASTSTPAANTLPVLSYVNSGQKLGTTNNWDVQVVDIDQNGTLDAYFEGSIWLNDGAGNFTRGDLSFGPPEQQAWFADVNGDGSIDAICDNVVFLNDGQNQFPDKKAIPSDITMSYAELADLNNDGAVDIIAASDMEDRILINDGAGNFTNTGKTLGGWGQCRYAVGNINGDEFTDVYVAIPHTPPPSMRATSNLFWLGDDSGEFSKSEHTDYIGESRDVVLKDFDGDEDLDLFIASGIDSGKVFINDGIGHFADSGQKINSGFHAADAEAADLDNDGDLDLFIANGKPLDSGQPDTIWLNDGQGNFSDSGQRLGDLDSIKLALGDLNGDGKTDAVVVNIDLEASLAPVEIWINTTQ
jgi:Tol biopolymer transport system component